MGAPPRGDGQVQAALVEGMPAPWPRLSELTTARKGALSMGRGEGQVRSVTTCSKLLHGVMARTYSKILHSEDQIRGGLIPGVGIHVSRIQARLHVHGCEQIQESCWYTLMIWRCEQRPPNTEQECRKDIAWTEDEQRFWKLDA